MADNVTILYGADGRAMSVRRKQASAFDAAGSGRRTKSWSASRDDINSLIFSNVDVLRDRCHDTIRKNPWAENALSSFVGNAVGVGIKPQSLHPDPAVRTKIHEAWNRWTDESDAYGGTDLYGQQRLACRAMRESGECFIRLRTRRSEDGLSVPLQLQILEAEHVPTYMPPSTQPVGLNRIEMGIELDAVGKPAAYHMYRDHPGSTAFASGAKSETVRVPADQVLHLCERLRPGQLRGLPWFTPVLLDLWELRQYTDAQILKQKVAAMFVGIVKTKNPADSVFPLGSRSGGVGEVDLEPGTTQTLLDGEDMIFSDPPDSGSFAEFVRVALRSIAAGLGITYEMLSGDMTQVNYSSARVALLEFRRRCEAFQHQVLAFQFCRPVFRAWLRIAFLSGALDLPGYAENPWPYENVRWVTPGFPWIDPLKDVKAKVMEVRAGFTSRAQVISEKGDDIEQIDSENQADFDRGDETGAIYESDPRQPQDAKSAGEVDAMIQQTEQDDLERQRRMVIQ